MTKEEREAQARMGRPPIPEEQRAIPGSLRLRRDRWEKLRRLGMDWLNKAIDKAKEPAPKE